MANLERFGRWLRNQIRRSDTNQSGLAARLGVSPTAVSDWVNAKREPSEENTRGLARVLSVPIEDVYAALGHIPPQDDDLPSETREVIALMRNATPENRALALRILRQVLVHVESEATEDTSGTAEAASE